MKALYFQHTIVFLLTPTLFLFSQNKTTESSPIATAISAENLNQFGEHKWELLVSQIGKYENMEDYGNPEINGRQTKLGIDLRTTYYVVNGLGVGLDLSFNQKGNYYGNGTDVVTNKYMGYFDLTYGRPITNNLGLFVRGGIGYGMINTTQKNGGNSSTIKNNDWGYRFEVGSPIRLGEGSTVYFTPQISYRSLTTTFVGSKEIKNGFQICLGLETFLGCDQMRCDHRSGLSRLRYQAGTSIIDYSTDGDYGIGSIKSEYPGGSENSQIDYSRGGLGLAYDYYPIHNVFIGAEFRLKNEVQKLKGADDKTTIGSWEAGPVIGFNIPVQNGFNNFSVSGGVKWGSDKTVISSGGGSSTQKINTFNYCVKLSFDNYITPNLSLSPSIEYDFNTNKYSNSSQELKSRGLEFRYGIRYTFGRSLSLETKNAF